MRGSVKKDERRGTWYFVIDNGINPETGKRRQVFSRGHATKGKAERKLNDKIKELQAGEYVEPSKEPLRDFLAEWIEAVRPTVKPSTAAGYEQKIKTHVAPKVGALPLCRVDAGTLNSLYGELLTNGGPKRDGLAPRTVLHVHKIMRRALRDAVRWGRLVRNPAELADPPRPRAPEMKTWSADELRRFLDSVRADRLYALFMTAAMTGMRRGELCGLRWDDVNVDAANHQRAQVPCRRRLRSRRRGEPKSGRSRTIDLDPTTVAELRAHRKRQLEERLAIGELWSDTGYVFTKVDGEPLHPHTVLRTFENRVKHAGVSPLSFHGLRHTHASLGLASGVPAKVMQERLGHANVSITLDLYSHVVPGMQRDAAGKIAALVLGS